MWNLRRWWLLLLRIATVLALVAAFAGPEWHASAELASRAGQSRGVVVLLDASASMQALEGSVSRFEMARGAVDQLLSELAVGSDSAEVVLVGQQPRGVLGAMSQNVPALRAEVSISQPTWEVADFHAAVDAASALLRRFEGRRQLVVVSDLQTHSWQSIVGEGRESKSSTELFRLPRSTEVVVVDLALDKKLPNTTIHSGSSQPTTVLAGQPVTFIAKVASHAPGIRQARVTAQLDGQPLGSTLVEVEPGEVRDVEFETRLSDSGVRQVHFQIDHDDFELDNQCFWVSKPRSSLDVAILSDDDVSRPGSAAFFLARALAPYRDRRDRFNVLSMTTRDLLSDTVAERLASQNAVFVGYLAELTEASADALERYVSGGGALVLYCGPGPVDRHARTLDRAVEGGWLPWVIGPLRNRDVREPFAITEGQWRSPLLRRFDLISQAALSDIPFFDVRNVSAVRGDTQVILRFGPGLPALGVRSHGLGRIGIANFSPDEESGQLAKFGGFVALAQSLAQGMRRDNSENRYHVGQPIAVTVSVAGDPTQVEILEPSSERLAVDRSVQRPGVVQIVSEPTAFPGIYEVRNGDELLRYIAVNLDPMEGDLATLDADLVQQEFDRVTAAGPAAAVKRSSLTEDHPFTSHGEPLWGNLLFIALLCSAVELGCLAFWRQ